jgi:hypothetical protein
MEIYEIIKELEYYKGDYPEKAIKEAVDRKDEIIPELLKQLDWITKHISVTINNKKYIGHLMAFLLLAQFEEKRAFPYIVKYFTEFRINRYANNSDFISRELQKVLPSCFDGDLPLLESVILNRSIADNIRQAFLMSFLTLSLYDIIDEEYLLGKLKYFFDNFERTPSDIWDIMIIICAAWSIEELLPEINKAYQDKLIDENIYPPEKLIPMIKSEEMSLYALPGLTKFKTEIEDTNWWKNISDYNYFADSEYDDDMEEEDQDQDMDSATPDDNALPAIINNNGLPVINASQKIGRNDPCPCGSGKKYKKCYGNKNE